MSDDRDMSQHAADRDGHLASLEDTSEAGDDEHSSILDDELDPRAVGPRPSTENQANSEGSGDSENGRNSDDNDSSVAQNDQVPDDSQLDDEGHRVLEDPTSTASDPCGDVEATTDKDTTAAQAGSAIALEDDTAPEDADREFTPQRPGSSSSQSPSMNGDNDWNSEYPTSIDVGDGGEEAVVGASEAGEDGSEDFGAGMGRLGLQVSPRRTFEAMSFGDDDSPMAPSDIMRHIPTLSGRDREAQAAIDALQEVYRDKLKPMEELSMFDKFHHDPVTDAELQAKPQVLLLGQYSTGKTSMIRHLIGHDFPAMHIGPEPSPAFFRAVMAGTDQRTISGSALCIVDELPYGGLGKFGASFLRHFQASIAPSPLLEHINFVDTPGILSGEAQGPRRGYPFTEVVKWFADRSDMILLVFDAHKLDMGEEFREVIQAIAHHGDRVRVVLNKAQEVDGDRLIKVYGALMWTIGRSLKGKPHPPKAYVGSFWSGPRRHPDDDPEGDDSFSVDEAALRREMLELPKNVGVRKINDVMQRAVAVKTHLQILYAVKARMPRFWGAEAAQERILASLEEVFDEVKSKGDVSEADMPDVEEYRACLRRIDFRDLPRRNRRLTAKMDDIIERDIKQCVTRAGGVRRLYKINSAAKISDSASPSRSARRATTSAAGRHDGRLNDAGESLFSLRGGHDARSSRRRSMLQGRARQQQLSDMWSKTSEVASPADPPEEDDEDDAGSSEGGTMNGLATETGGDTEVPFLMGTLFMVLVVLVGFVVGLWQMDALPNVNGLPALPDWVRQLKVVRQ